VILSILFDFLIDFKHSLVPDFSSLFWSFLSFLCKLILSLTLILIGQSEWRRPWFHFGFLTNLDFLCPKLLSLWLHCIFGLSACNNALYLFNMDFMTSVTSSDCPKSDHIVLRWIADHWGQFLQFGFECTPAVVEVFTDLWSNHAFLNKLVIFPYFVKSVVLFESVDSECELAFLVTSTLIFALQAEVHWNVAAYNRLERECVPPLVWTRYALVDVIELECIFLSLLLWLVPETHCNWLVDKSGLTYFNLVFEVNPFQL